MDMSDVDEETADKVLREYEEHGDMNVVAANLGVHTGKIGTLLNDPDEYVDDPSVYDIEFGTDDEEEDVIEGFTADPPPRTREKLEDEGMPDFQEMSPGDFVKWFFDQDGFGVASSFVNRLSSRCDVRGALPNQNEMVNTIIEGNSRISNSFDAKMIAETYADALERYRDANGMGRHSRGETRTVGGEWVGTDGGAGSGGDRPASGGEWTDVSGGRGGQQPPREEQRQRGRGRRDGRGSGRGGGRGTTRGATGDQRDRGRGRRDTRRGDGGGSVGVNDKVAEALNEIRETQAELAQAVKQQQRSNGRHDAPTSLAEQANEIAEARDALEKVIGDQSGGPSEEVRDLRDELRDVHRKLEREAEGGDTVDVDGGGDVAALAQMAAQGDIDTETLSVLADSMGVTDPDVKKAEYDYKATQEKLRQREELFDSLFENLGDGAGNLVSAFLESMGDGGDGGDDADDGSGPEGVKPAGSANMGDGEIQVVDAGGSADSQDLAPDRGGDSPMSPSRERHADALETIAGGDDGGDSDMVGDFRGPDEGGASPERHGCEYVDPDTGEMCGDPTQPGGVFCADHSGGS